MRCQSVMQPSTAEYWHIGAITMRLASSSLPTVKGLKSWDVMGTLLAGESHSFRWSGARSIGCTWPCDQTREFATMEAVSREHYTTRRRRSLAGAVLAVADRGGTVRPPSVDVRPATARKGHRRVGAQAASLRGAKAPPATAVPLLRRQGCLRSQQLVPLALFGTHATTPSLRASYRAARLIGEELPRPRSGNTHNSRHWEEGAARRGNRCGVERRAARPG